MNPEAADLSDNLTRAIRDRNWSAVSAVRDRLDLDAGREPWKLTDPPRPSIEETERRDQ
jgi:hypothetical protein